MKDVDCSKSYRNEAVHTIVIHPARIHAENRTRRSGQGGITQSHASRSNVARLFIPGSLKWLVALLEPGESLLRVDASESGRRACQRAIDAVMMHDPSRKHDVSLWYAVHHTGRGESFRMLKLKRRA